MKIKYTFFVSVFISSLAFSASPKQPVKPSDIPNGTIMSPDDKTVFTVINGEEINVTDLASKACQALAISQKSYDEASQQLDLMKHVINAYAETIGGTTPPSFTQGLTFHTNATAAAKKQLDESRQHNTTMQAMLKKGQDAIAKELNSDSKK